MASWGMHAELRAPIVLLSTYLSQTSWVFKTWRMFVMNVPLKPEVPPLPLMPPEPRFWAPPPPPYRLPPPPPRCVPPIRAAPPPRMPPPLPPPLPLPPAMAERGVADDDDEGPVMDLDGGGRGCVRGRFGSADSSYEYEKFGALHCLLRKSQQNWNIINIMRVVP